MVKNQSLPHREVRKRRLAQLKAAMRRGNTLLVHWHDQVLTARGITNQELPRSSFRVELFALAGETPRAVFFNSNGEHRKSHCRGGITIPKSDIAAMCVVRDAQQEILQGFSKLISRQARKWSRRVQGNFPGYWDFHGDAVAAMIEAIYGFRKRGIKFITYATWVVENRLLDAYNEANPLSPWTVRDRKLNQQVDEARRQAAGPRTLDELADHLELDDKLRGVLHRMVPTVVYASGHDDENGEAHDYTSLGQDVRTTRGIRSPAEATELREVLSPLQVKVIESLDFSPFEMDVLESSYTDGTNGWQTRVANRHRNPRTGKSYSRRAPALVIRRLRERICTRYREMSGGREWEEAAA